jgi:hypothetical protein
MSEYKFDKDELLEKTNGGLDVIRLLFPECKKGNKFVHFKLRDEATASANVYKSKGIYKVKDHGDGTPKNAIDLVMDEENLSFSEACFWIAKEFGISEGNTSTLNKPGLEIKKATSKQKHGEYFFKYKKFTEKELAVLGPLVTAEYCKKYNFKSCESFVQIKTYEDDDRYGNDTMQIITSSTDRYPIFVIDNKTWQKIYQPLNEKKQYRFRYVGKKPGDFIFGLENLKLRYKKFLKESEDEELDEDEDENEGKKDKKPKVRKLDRVIIASGDRDALNIAALGYSVIWLNSETAKLTWETYSELFKMCHEICYLGDIDETGVKESIKLSLDFINIKIVWLPESLKKFKYRGKSCKDFKDYMDHFHKVGDKKFIEKQFQKLLYDALPSRFWNEVKEKGTTKYLFNNEACYRFLQYKGFYRFEEDTAKEEFSFIHIEDGVVKRVPLHHLSNFPGEYIKATQSNIGLLNFMHRSAQLNERSLAKLEQKKIDFSDCDFDYQLLYFTNKVWKITKDSIVEHKPGEIPGAYVWEDKIIQHEVKVAKTPMFNITHNGKKFDIEILKKDNHFLNYLINTSRMYWRKTGDKPFNERLKAALKLDTKEQYDNEVEQIKKDRIQYQKDHKFMIDEAGLTKDEIQIQKEHLINKIFAFGYLLHKKKVDDKAWCVFAMDNNVSHVSDSDGGTGKSLVYDKGIRSVLLSNMYKAGRDKEMLKNKHLYEGVDMYTDYVLYDDLDQHFPFGGVFSEITGDLPVNPKFGKQYVLPYSQSPKFAMTSNFGVFNGAEGSTDRRILYTEFSDYYHHKGKKDELAHKPKSDYNGKMLFSQFDKNEWNDFYNFAAESIKFFLTQDDQVRPPGEGNIQLRNAISTMTPAFYDWTKSYLTKERLNVFIHKKEALDNYRESQGVKNWTSQMFMKSFGVWCTQFGYELNPKERDDSQGRCKHRFYGKSEDALFIRPKGYQIQDLNDKIKSQQPPIKPEGDNPTLNLDE